MRLSQQLVKKLDDLHLLKHPFYQDWMIGRLTANQLKTYATQYANHVNAFPRYISALHSQTVNPIARRVLLENLNDEEGFVNGKPHPDLWNQFAEAVGSSQKEIEETPASPAITNVIQTFRQAANSSYAEGLGALFAYERQIPEIATNKIEGLKNHYLKSNIESGTEFFEVHKEADVYHRNVLMELIDNLSEKDFALAESAANRSAQALWDFLTEVHVGLASFSK